ncbi:sigma-70 family RNA polymerase sigma factor [Actinomadura sp. SCN-SB]|uniref:RNA polymerase sigma factor n=1 Tax=Actinomadura sp. SCN-SB TaxID=3373092 RepID=UPI003753D3A5
MPRWSTSDVAADRRLVQRLNDGDANALAALYDAYAERLYDYALSMTGEYRIAADITHDTFIDAARRAPRMRDHQRLRSWLYGAVRRRCVQRARSRVLYWEPDVDFGDAWGHSETPRTMRSGPSRKPGTAHDSGESSESSEPEAEAPVDAPPHGVLAAAMRGSVDEDPSQSVRERPERAPDADEPPPSSELRRLLDGSVARLEPCDQEALLLAVRHELSAAEIGSVHGVSPRRAATRVARARTRLDEAYTTELKVATERCAVGQAEDHRECTDCRRRAGVNPAALLAFASAPVLPASLRHRVLHTATDPELAGYRNDIAARGGALTPHGMPTQPDTPSPYTKRWLFAGGGMAGALVTAVLGAMLISPGLGDPTIYWPPFRARPQPSVTDHVPRQPQGGGTGQEPPRDGVAPSAPGATPPAGSQGQGASPPSTGAPTSPAPPRPGTLIVTPARVELYMRKTATVRLEASQGPVSWNATSSSEQLSVSHPQGELAADTTADVTVTLRTHLINLPGQATLTFSDPTTGTTREVTVVWGASLL